MHKQQFQGLLSHIQTILPHIEGTHNKDNHNIYSTARHRSRKERKLYHPITSHIDVVRLTLRVKNLLDVT